MKIVVTGSLGNISQPLTAALVEKGHDVTVISSSPERKKEIEEIGAVAAIGSLEDVAFLTNTFKGADAVYCMVPPNNYFDPDLDVLEYYRRIATHYAKAIEQSGVNRVIHLSSIGAHTSEGNGLLVGHYYVEEILRKLPDINLTHLRPVGFYYNLFGFIPIIKDQGMIAANWGADATAVWVSPLDIAAAVVEELESNSERRKIRYVASDELTGNETAHILGEAIGKPDLKWIIISSEVMLEGLKGIGMNPEIAAGLVEMYESQQHGLLWEDYYKNKPDKMGNVKMTDFAKEFAAAYQQG